MSSVTDDIQELRDSELVKEVKKPRRQKMIKSHKVFRDRVKLVRLPADKCFDLIVYSKSDKPLYGYATEDFKFAKEFWHEHPEVYPYTIIDTEEGLIIVDGWHWVNRFGYLFGENKVDNVEVEWEW